MTPERATYIRKETTISVAINIVIGALFFMLLFHGQAQVPLWGAGGVVADCLPQGFMIGLMSVVPPSLLTRKRIASGTVARSPGIASRLPQSLLVRALLMALLAMIALTVAAALVVMLSGAQTAPFALAFVLKAVAGGVIALVVTPMALRAMLAG